MNKRIQEEHGDENPPEVIVDRFRPNVFFETDKALEEDTWKNVKINDAEFEFLSEFRWFVVWIEIDFEPIRFYEEFEAYKLR